MENVTVNTEKLCTQISELSQKKGFYFQTKNDFCSSNYGATDILASLLSKIQSNYVLISSNIEEIVKYLENYCNNIEGIETMMAHQGGNISESSIYAIVQRSMNLMKKLEISNHSDFSMIPVNVNRYSSTSSSNSFTHITLNINASDSYMINFSSLESIMNYFCYYESNNSNALEQIIRKIGAAIHDFTDNENIHNEVINCLRKQGDFIFRTYKEVIRDNYFHNQYQDAVYKVSYDNVSSEQFANIFYFANNDALVFRILYSQDSKKYSDTDFVKNLHEKKNFLEDIKRQIINEVKEKLQMECYVFEEKRFD